MFNQSGAVAFDAILENSQFKSSIAEMNRGISGLTRSVQKESKEIDNTFKNLGRAAAGYFAFSELAGLPTKLIQVRGEFQQLETAFTTMLGSKSKADALFKDVVKFAAVTPFDLKGVASASKQLLAYGIASEEVVGTLRRLGDVSSGLNIPLGELTELYGKTKTNGRLFAEDLNQYVGRGIPMIALLADQFKVAESEVRGLVEQGKVGFPEIERAINKLTDAGGTFAGLMEANSKSLTGLYSNFEDAVEQMFNKVGESQEGLLGDSIRFATDVVENYEPILDVLKVIIATYGTYKAAVISTAVVQAAATKGGAVMAWLELATSIRSAKDAQIAFNLATKANPYALAASAMIALITAVALFRQETNETTKAQERAIQIGQKHDQQKAEETTKIQILTKQISDETKTREERNRKLKELIAMSPAHFNALTIETVATAKGADAIRDYTKALEKKLQVQASEEQIVGNNKRVQEIRSGVSDEEFQPNLFERTKFFLQDSGFDEKLFKKETDRRKQAAIKALEEENKALLKVAAEGANDISKVPPKPKAELPKKDVGKAAKEEKDVNIQTFEDELAEKKKMYEVYQRWVENFSEPVAKLQFSSLIAENQNYVDYLNTEIAKLEEKAKSGILSKDNKVNFDLLITERNIATGAETPLQAFTKELDEAQESAKTLTEYLEYLRKKQSELGGVQNPINGEDKKKELAQRINATEKGLKENLNGFLQEAMTYAQKRQAIEVKFQEQRRTAQKNFQGQELEDAEKSIDYLKKTELEALADEQQEKSEAYKQLHAVAIEFSRKRLNQDLENVQKLLAEESISAERKKQLELDLTKTRKELNKDTADSFRAAGEILSNAFGDASLKFSKNLEISVREVSSLLSSVATLVDKGSSKASKVSSLVDIFSFLTVSVRDALMTQEDLVTGMEPQEAAYRRIANEIEGINMLLERQRYLLDNLQGRGRTEGIVDLIGKATKEQQDALQGLADLTVDVIKSQKEVFVDPVWGTEVENKGLKAFYANIVTLGQAKTKIKYEFESVNTDGLKSIEDWIKFRAEIAKNGGMIDGKQVTDADLQAIDAYIERFQKAEELQKQLLEELGQFLTGTTESAIVDSIVDGFQNGKSSAADFADDFENMMKNAVLNGLKADMFNEGLKSFYQKFKDYSLSGGSLDEKEIAELKSDYDAYIAWSKQMYDNAEKITGIKLSENQGRAPQVGIAGSMTEQTAGKIEGQFNALRISNASIDLGVQSLNQNARSSLFELTAINLNTRELFAIRASLDSIDRVLKSDIFRAVGGG